MGIILYTFHSNEPQGGRYTVLRLQFAGGVLAVPIDRSWLDPQLASDLLGIEVGMDQPEALTFPFRQHGGLQHRQVL